MIVLLDNGHGGMINGRYQTPGKRSPIWSDGSQLFEGEFNRAIVNRVIEGLTRLGIPYVNIAPEYRDVSLETRVNRANAYRNQPCFYLSVHANAGGGTGWEVFTSPGNTTSDSIAELFAEEYQRAFPNLRLRADTSDGDKDKEANFYVLKKTAMPAILTENFFMDNENECKFLLMAPQSRDKIADLHIAAIRRAQREIF